MTTNQRVKIVLKKYDINITQMCKELSWSREAFSRVANGHRALSVEKAKAIGNKYNFSWTEFFIDPENRYIEVTKGIKGSVVQKLDYKKFVEIPSEWVNTTECLLTLGDAEMKYTGELSVFEMQKLDLAELKNYKKNAHVDYLITTKRGQFFGSIYYEEGVKHFFCQNIYTLTSVYVPVSTVKYVQRIKAYMPVYN